MGCISSKGITRSISIREELTHRFQSKTSAWEELLASSRTGNDQLFALIHSSNASSTKLRTTSFTFASIDSETVAETKSLGNPWDLITDINTKALETAVEEPDCSRFMRSKSCQMASEKEILWLSPDQLNENKLDWKDKNMRGSRSFHTVEEYDALLERIHRLRSTSIESFEDYCISNSVDESENEKCTEETCEHSSGIEDDHDLDHKGSESQINSGNFVQTEGVRENGWKRKTVAKGLKSLDVGAVEFPAVARFRQRMREGEVYSPGTYDTPKFGSYNGDAVQEEERVESTVFSAELLAEFEDCMKRLQVDEESILMEMENEVEDFMKR